MNSKPKRLDEDDLHDMVQSIDEDLHQFLNHLTRDLHPLDNDEVRERLNEQFRFWR